MNGAYPDEEALAQKKVPILRTLRNEESTSDQSSRRAANGSLDPASVEHASERQAGHEDQSVLTK